MQNRLFGTLFQAFAETEAELLGFLKILRAGDKDNPEGLLKEAHLEALKARLEVGGSLAAPAVGAEEDNGALGRVDGVHMA